MPKCSHVRPERSLEGGDYIVNLNRQYILTSDQNEWQDQLSKPERHQGYLLHTSVLHDPYW